MLQFLSTIFKHIVHIRLNNFLLWEWQTRWDKTKKIFFFPFLFPYYYHPSDYLEKNITTISIYDSNSA
jgi:hypothetical protein